MISRPPGSTRPDTLFPYPTLFRSGIPVVGRLSDILEATTGLRIVAVPGLVPDDVFFGHMAARRFPVTWLISRRDQIDYIQEPDVFHHIYGHVPLLMNPVFADYMQAYGAGGLEEAHLGALHHPIGKASCRERVWPYV